MAEHSFNDIMHQWRRMCDAVTKSADESGEQNACAVCGLMPGNNCVAIYEDPRPDYRRIEDVVMHWAAEHPEPVYPSVAKYLERLGIIIRRDGTLQADFFKANEPMSVDVAKLLGVGSVEGENEKTD